MRWDRVDIGVASVWTDWSKGRSVGAHVDHYCVVLPTFDGEPVRLICLLDTVADSALEFGDGVRVGGRGGQNRTAVVDIEHVERLSEHPDVVRLALSKRYFVPRQRTGLRRVK